MFAPLCMSWTPDAEAFAFAEDVTAALDANYTRKDAADRLGLTVSQLSEWLSCARPFNAYRLTALTDTAFWDDLLELRATRRGGLYLKPDVVMVLRGASNVRRMAKMAPKLAQKRSA